MSPAQLIRKRRLSHKRLGEILVDQGLISEEQLACAVGQVHTQSKRLGEVLIGMQAASEEDILQAFVHQYSFPFVRLSDYEVDPDVVRIIPHTVALEHTVFPVEKFLNNLTVAFSNPLDLAALEKLQSLSGCNVQAFVSTGSEIKRMIKTYYTGG